MDRVFQTFIDSLRGNADVAALRIAMTEIAMALDLGSFAYLFAERAPKAQAKLISNYPASWTSQYLLNGYEEIDPVIAMARQTRERIQWGREHWYNQPREQQVHFLEDLPCFLAGLQDWVKDTLSRFSGGQTA